MVYKKIDNKLLQDLIVKVCTGGVRANQGTYNTLLLVA